MLSGQNPSAHFERSAIRSEGIDLSERDALVELRVGRKRPRRCLRRSDRHSSPRLNPRPSTRRAGPSGYACTRHASRTGARRSPPSAGAMPSTGDRRVLRRGHVLGLRKAGSQEFRNRIAGPFARGRSPKSATWRWQRSRARPRRAPSRRHRAPPPRRPCTPSPRPGSRSRSRAGTRASLRDECRRSTGCLRR